MPTYNYKALKRGRDVVKGQIEAADSKEARDKIRKEKRMRYVSASVFCL